MERHGEELDLETDEARGGSTPHIVRYVLLISLFLAAAAMTIVWVTGALNVSQDPTVDPSAPAGVAAEDTTAGGEDLSADFTAEQDQTNDASGAEAPRQ